MSQHSAMSLPPATACPFTWAEHKPMSLSQEGKPSRHREVVSASRDVSDST
jgi:hypothetical protein